MITKQQMDPFIVATTSGTGPDRVPTLEEALDTFGYHVGCLMTDKPVRPDAPYCERAMFGLGMGGWSEGCPYVHVDVVIRPASQAGEKDGGPWGGWAQVSLDGRCFGNRHGGYKEYARLCAPVIAWVAAYWAAKALEPTGPAIAAAVPTKFKSRKAG